MLQAAGASADAVAPYVYGNDKMAATKHAPLTQTRLTSNANGSKRVIFYTDGGVLQAAGASADAVTPYVYGNDKTAATKHAPL